MINLKTSLEDSFINFINEMEISMESGYHANKKIMKKAIKNAKKRKNEILSDPSASVDEKIEVIDDIIYEIDLTIKEIKDSYADGFDEFIDTTARLANKAIRLCGIVVTFVAGYNLYTQNKGINLKDPKNIASTVTVVGANGVADTICTINQKKNTIWYKSRKKSDYISKLEHLKVDFTRLKQELQRYK